MAEETSQETSSPQRESEAPGAETDSGTPRRGGRWPLRGAKLWIAALAAFLLMAGVGGGVYAFAFYGQGEPPPLVLQGRSLELHLTHPVVTDQVAFQTGGEHRVIRPRATNRQLALVNVTVVNRTSIVTPMLIDEDAAQLGSKRGERISPIDPFESSTVVDEPAPNEGEYTPFLWGDVTLDRNFQVKGWMVFDVPKGLLLGTLWWREVDDIIGDYVDYSATR